MREDLIASAVTFLQDPSVAASPLEKRVAFLQSKNLTREEVDAALRRTGENAATVSNVVATTNAYPSIPPSPYGGGYFPPQQLQLMPPELPRRDWRDWFIMATVTTGVSYGLFHLAKRYVVPLISPPTPAALETDKASIDAKFAEAFALLDTLKSDTSDLKSAEEARKERVDAALAEVETVVQSLKDAGKRREDESKRVGDEVRGLRDLIPKALEGHKESQKKALEDLQSELKSLKQLVMNRTGARPSFLPNGSVGTPPLDPGAPSSTNGGGGGIGGIGGSGGNGIPNQGGQAAPTNGMQRTTSISMPFGNRAGGSPAIPAWQMAAKNASATGPPPPNAALGGENGTEASSG